MTVVLLYILLISLAIYAVFKFRYELHMLQQNSYRNERYTRWFKGNFLRADRGLEFFFGIIALPIAYFFPVVGAILYVLIYSFLSWRFYNKKHKKALVLTNRAKRILVVSLVLFTLLIGTIYYFHNAQLFSFTASSWLGLVLSPIILLLANTLLKPYEKYNHNWYINDAKKMLQSMPNLTIIGITGSYGKTSTKHFLNAVLSQKYNVLMTPGSFNTPMGVVRTVREQLKPYHEIFIVEMGAKQKGDIKEICDIAHPSIGILTAVGPAHLETFKSIENICATKFELIDALPNDGFAVLNGDYDIIKNRGVQTTKAYYGVKNMDAQFSIENIVVTSQGSTFSVQKDKVDYGHFQTKLLGEHNLSNLAAAVAVAEHLGVSNKQMEIGIKKLQPVQHRLSIRKISGGITILDDAFNSNAVGARMATEVLGQMEGKRKIIVTPGMVELGDKAYELNKIFGTQIAKNADLAILVGQTNKDAITEGLQSENFPESKIYHAANFDDATKWLGARMQTGDVILYENDLPDSYK